MLNTHSGLQASYGFPLYSEIHSHTPPGRHIAFGPHGVGLQGSVWTGEGVAEKYQFNLQLMLPKHYKYFNRFIGEE